MQNNQDIKTDAEPDEKILKDLWPKISERVLKPNAHKLGEIFFNGEVACVVFELLGQADAAARALGWDGESPVFRMSNKRRNRFANVLEQSFGDVAAARWLRGRRKGRLFLLVHGGTLCVNYKPRQGWEIEPGTLDAERRQGLN